MQENNTKNTEKKQKIGRPQWIPPDLKKVEQYAAQGMTQDQIAAALGINRSTLYDKKKQFRDFADAIDRGKAKGISIVTSRLMQQVESGNTDAIKFYLSRRADWRETPAGSITVESGQDGAKTKITLTDLYKQMNAE
jgi:DNA-binding XRE family transcriptional regulator